MAPSPRRARVPLADLGRRERQILEILVRRGRATASEILDDLPDPPSNAAVRGMLRHLEGKNQVRHEWDGPRHVWLPLGNPAKVKESAARHLLTTLFDGSLESALAAMLGGAGKAVTHEDLDRLARLIEQTRETTEGRR